MFRALAGTSLPVLIIVLAVGVLAGLAPAGGPAWAEDPYPTRPVSMVVAFPPGGLADNTARPVATALERILKQPVAIGAGPIERVPVTREEIRAMVAAALRNRDAS